MRDSSVTDKSSEKVTEIILATGERNFTIDTLEKIYAALQIDVADLFGHDTVKNKDEVARQQATDEFIAMISNLDSNKIEIIKRINKELIQAFNNN
ncbi:XRE family transcriptional regulator [Paenibacillus sp. D2_2]|uniref:XRE family transcriptional regulator n=1 Tax=Paenibacillus sp. D2_2 TaxID=3073092 RepID=UPI002816454D|nr:XRE family transcriptional regulator [Paenibacillus sp. D2_2]WMT40966.1 XRE family transcriptional regulator [Paenibacillus sp. D2_2]